MIDLDEYLERIARIGGECVDLTDYAAKFLGDRYGSGDQTVIECADFRRTMLTVGDRDTGNCSSDSFPSPCRLMSNSAVTRSRPK